MKKNKIQWIIKIIFGTLLFALILGILVWSLWNALIPTLFGLKPITYLQALGLLILFRIITGNLGPRGFGPRRGMNNKRGFLQEKWNSMTEEERKEWFSKHS